MVLLGEVSCQRLPTLEVVTTSNDGLERSVASTGTSSLGRQTKASSEDGAAIYRSLGTASSPRPKFSCTDHSHRNCDKGRHAHSICVRSVLQDQLVGGQKEVQQNLDRCTSTWNGILVGWLCSAHSFQGRKMFGSLSHPWSRRGDKSYRDTSTVCQKIIPCGRALHHTIS